MVTGETVLRVKEVEKGKLVSNFRLIAYLPMPLKLMTRSKTGLSQYMSKSARKLTEMFKISKNCSVPLNSKLFHQKVNHYDL